MKKKTKLCTKLLVPRNGTNVKKRKNIEKRGNL